MWPILFKVDQISSCRPLLAGIFCGENKPFCVKEFLNPFVHELKILEDGIMIMDRLFHVRISCIIADAPARSFVKGTKGHTAYHGRKRCEDEGSWAGRMTYSCKPHILRTDDRFKLQIDSDHHVNVSPFLELDIGLVSQVVLDYMHLICLGVTRKLFNLWTCGPLLTRLPAKNVRQISLYLHSISKSLPEEFARKPRSLRDLNRFKATEFRTLLLYTGPCALRGVLPTRQFEHFMLLSCATYILLSKDAANPGWNKIAQKLIQDFVIKMQSICGSSTIVYNVHSLLHMADNALNYSCLDNVSAFPFENYLQRIKKMVRGQKLHLQQVVKRVLELENTKRFVNNSVRPLGPRKLKGTECKKFYTKDMLISSRDGDNCFVSKNKRILLVRQIKIENGIASICVQEFIKTKPVFSYPIDLKLLNIEKVTPKFSATRWEGIECLKTKCVSLPYKYKSVNYLCRRRRTAH
jgi:hypothetical protein